MAALERVAPDLRTVPAAHVAFQLIDRRRLGTTHNVERDGLMGIDRSSGPQGIRDRRSVHRRESGRAGPVPGSRACAGSRPRRRAGQPACALLSRAPPMHGSSCRRSISRDFVPMAQGCPRSSAMGKPLSLVDCGGDRRERRRWSSPATASRSSRCTACGCRDAATCVATASLPARSRASNRRLSRCAPKSEIDDIASDALDLIVITILQG